MIRHFGRHTITGLSNALLITAALTVAGCASNTGSEAGSGSDQQAGLDITAAGTGAEIEENAISLTQSTEPASGEEDAPARTSATGPVEPEDEVEYGSFTRDQLTRAIMNELSGQRGNLESAAEDYRLLARETGDLDVIRRASQFASAIDDTDALIELSELWARIRPDDLEPQLMLSFQLLDRGEFERALEHMSRVVELGGSVDFAALSARAGSLDPAQRSGVIDTIARLRDAHPEEESLHYALVQLLDQNGETAAGLKELEQLKREHGASSRTALLEAQLLRNQGDVDQALAVLEGALDNSPTSSSLRYNYARLLAEDEQFGPAIAEFESLTRDNPQNYDALFSLALLHFQMESLEEARLIFSQLVNVNHRRNESRFYLGYINEAQGDIDSAVAYYKQVQPGTGNFLNAQRQATRLLIGQNRLSEAREWLIRLSQGRPEMRILFSTIEAEALMAEGHLERAQTLLDSTIDSHPDNIDLLFSRSLLSERTGDMAQLEQDLRRIIELDPDNARALNHLGYALVTKTDRYEEAHELIERAVQIEPDDPAIIDSLAWVQYKLGQHEEALSNLRRAFAAFPDPEVAAHLGEVLWVMGEQREAKQVWDEALERQPDSEILKEVIERLDPQQNADYDFD